MEEYIKTYNELHRKYESLDGFDFDVNDLDNSVASYSYNTCGIEGNTFSLGETEIFLRSGQVIKGHSLREHNEIKGSEEGFRTVFSLASEGKRMREDVAMMIHRKVLQLVDPDKAGKYKTIANRVDGYSTPYPAKAKMLFPKAIQRFNEDLKTKHPMIAGAELHLNTAIIHPFLDGNGRCARLYHNFALISKGHSQIQFQVKDRENYINAIRETRDSKDPNVFIKYSFEVAIQSLKKKVNYLEAEKKNPIGGVKVLETNLNLEYDLLESVGEVNFYD